MQESKSYREYAAFCRQLARTMDKKDSKVLMDMAAAWDARAEQAVKQEAKTMDGGRDQGASR
jgi:hypothetical protein